VDASYAVDKGDEEFPSSVAAAGAVGVAEVT